jgi:Zn-dependent peptidase ImmA (M78 family)
MEIADALEIDLSYLLRSPRVQNIEPAYRMERSTSMTVKEKGALMERIRDWLERYLEAEETAEAGPAAFTARDGFPYPVASMGDAEAAAMALREAWNLGTDPIENVTALLEDHGIRVGVIEADDAFDACTFWAEITGGVPVIVTRQELPGDRQRFHLAHELGHLLLDVDDDLDAETVCHRFARALLAPESAVRDAVGEMERQNLILDELHLLKHRFGLSMQALFVRLKDLRIVSEATATRAHRMFRKRGWHREEPGDPVASEKPDRFQLLVLRALGEGLIGENRARELWGGPIAELESSLQPVA